MCLWHGRNLVGTSLWDVPFRCGISIIKPKNFCDGKPWLLRFFDQIQFYEVSHEELMQLREEFPRGKVELTIEKTTFSLKAYNEFLKTMMRASSLLSPSKGAHLKKSV